MTVHLLDGFELEKTSTSFLRRYPGALGIPSNLPDQAGRLGGKCLRIETATVIPMTIPIPVGSGIFTCGLGIYIDSINESAQFSLLKVFTSGHTLTLEVIIKRLVGDTGFRIEVRRYTTSGYRVDADLSYTLDFGEWWFIEVQDDLSTSIANLRLRINEDTVVSINEADSTVFGGYEELELRGTPGPSSYILIDDFSISDTDFFGRLAQISGLYPNADGPSSDWGAVGGPDGHYDAVDDAAIGAVDDDVSYLIGSASGAQELLNFSAQINSKGRVEAIELAIDGTTDAGDEALETLIQSTKVRNLTIFSGGYQRYSEILETDISTSRKWDTDDLDSILAGFKIPGTGEGSGNLYAPLTLEDGSFAEVWLNDEDILVIQNEFGQDRYVASSNQELDLFNEFGQLQKVPLNQDTEAVNIAFGLFQARHSPAAVEADVPKYRKAHLKGGDDNLIIDINLENPAQAGTVIAYDIEGDAVEGTHFNIIQGASPINVPEGVSTVQIELSFPQLSKWFLEKNAYFKFNLGASSRINIDSLTDEYRVFIRSHKSPPIAFTTLTSDSGGIGAHDIEVALSDGAGGDDPTNELVTLHWKQIGGSAVEGVDFEFSSPSGSVIITPPAKVGDIPLEILPTRTIGKDLQLILDYEDLNIVAAVAPSQNLHTSSENYEPEHPDGATEIWPGDPGDNVGGGVKYDDLISPNQVVTVFDPVETLPDGSPLPVSRLRPGYDDSPANGIGYVRKSLEDWTYTDGAPDYHKIKKYNYYGVTVRDHQVPGLVQSEYLTLSLRDRGVDIVNKKLRNVDTLHGEGDHNLVAWFRRTGPNTWVVHDLQSTGGGAGGYPSIPGVAGIGTDPETGDPVLWVMRVETNSVRLAVAGNNILFRPVNHPSEGADLHLTDAIGHYNSMFISSDEINGIPTVPTPPYWPKLRNWHEPRGGAICDRTRIFTFTIDS